MLICRTSAKVCTASGIMAEKKLGIFKVSFLF